MGFQPPPYPYDRLDAVREVAAQTFGQAIDCSVGTPCDPPPAAVVHALGHSDAERGYPTSAGAVELRDEIASYLGRRFDVELGRDDLALCVGTKEFVASTAHYLHLRDPARDCVLYPAVSYPTYAMGATLAGLRAVEVPMAADGSLDLGAIDPKDAASAQCLWSNSPSNPTGALDDLLAVAQWGRAHGVPVLSDECYAEFTWDGPAQTVLSSGLEGVLAVHSISKRSNLAGVRCGFYAGDRELVSYLKSVRQHAGMMVPGPVQRAVQVAYSDQTHVEAQAALYLARLDRATQAFAAAGISVDRPAGTFYLWIATPENFADDWEFATYLARVSGLILSPGEFYGEAGKGSVRLAAVVNDATFDLGLERLAVAGTHLG